MRGGWNRGRESGYEAARKAADTTLAAIRQGDIARLYLLSGDDDYQRQAVLKQILKRLVPPGEEDTCLTVLKGSETSGSQLATELEATGFRFGDEPLRVVLVRDAPYFHAGKGGDTEPLLSRISAGLLEDTTLILEVRGKIDKRLRLTKAVEDQGVAIEFPALADSQDASDLLVGRVRDAGKRISASAMGHLVERRGLDALVLTHEIDKLICYVGDRERIDDDDVLKMVAPTAEISVFGLVDAVADRQPKQALDQLGRLLEQQAEPFLILAMLIRQFRLLIQARYLLDQDLIDRRLLSGRPYDFQQTLLSKRDGMSLLDQLKVQTAEVLPGGRTALLGQHYFPLFKSLIAARRLEAPLLEACLERVLQTDLALKSTHLEPVAELEWLVVDLCTRPAEGCTVDYDTLLDT